MKLFDRMKSPAPLSHVVEIAETFIPANDNDRPTSSSRENFEPESIVSRLNDINPRQGSQTGPIVAIVLCFMVLAASIALLGTLRF